jgi:hypothetical protein
MKSSVISLMDELKARLNGGYQPADYPANPMRVWQIVDIGIPDPTVLRSFVFTRRMADVDLAQASLTMHFIFIVSDINLI